MVALLVLYWLLLERRGLLGSYMFKPLTTYTCMLFKGTLKKLIIAVLFCVLSAFKFSFCFIILLSLLTFLFFYEQYLQNDKLVERVTVSLHIQTKIIPKFKWAAKFPSFIVCNSFVFLNFSGHSLMKDVLTMMVKPRLMTSSNLSRPTNFLLLQNSMMR